MLNTKKNNNNIDVNLASHTHHTPQVGFPHILPVTSEINVNIIPICAIDLAIILKIGFLVINQRTEEPASIVYAIKANQADGTCIYIILMESPWI